MMTGKCVIRIRTKIIFFLFINSFFFFLNKNEFELFFSLTINRGEIIDTGKDGEKNKWIFVVDPKENIYVGKKTKGKFQHSSFLAGFSFFSLNSFLFFEFFSFLFFKKLFFFFQWNN